MKKMCVVTVLLCMNVSICLSLQKQEFVFAVPQNRAPRKARIVEEKHDISGDVYYQLQAQQQLSIAVKENDITLAQAALKYGIDLSTTKDLFIFSNEQEQFPHNCTWPLLHYACWNGTLEMVKLLIEGGKAASDAHYRSDDLDYTPLQCAIARKVFKNDQQSIAIIEYLLSKK